MRDKHTPLATYRLQFNYQFPFKKAIAIVDYLHRLGISHYYVSPIFKAKTGSTHGYDIIDHSTINPEIGSEEEFENLVGALKDRHMGLILDIVPNHMYILDAGNKWWQDVLENGPSSAFADYFDIDWNPPRKQLKYKVMLPVLELQYGNALENQTLKALYKEGSFYVERPGQELPTDPSSWNLLLDPVAKELQEHLEEDNPHLLELQSIITALNHLPAVTDLEEEKIAERQREKEVIKRRLSSLTQESSVIHEVLSAYLQKLNGDKDDPRSFDDLEIFVNAQPYRLGFWRVANDEINYRRFFDILELAGLRTNKPAVFEATHLLVFNLMQRKLIDGLRIDHIDGLWDPEQYLEDLHKLCRQALHEKEGAFEKETSQSTYVVVEKILTGNEKLRADWLTDGTVGYDFLNQLNGLYVVQQNKKSLINIYQEYTDLRTSAFDLMYSCKKLNLLVSLSSELHVLARHLDLVSEQHRHSRDFTAESLKSALREVIACFPVYRSYIRAKLCKINEEDRQYIITAISRAKRKNPAISASIFDFIQSLLLLEFPEGLSEGQIKERQNFVMRFQQLTSPVMAKGAEDTAFYRYYPLCSIREVGTDMLGFGTSLEVFQKKNQERFEFWPKSMNTTSTHDTKRSEDVRARINVLSEIPEDWEKALHRWTHLNKDLKVEDGDEIVPDANEEYLFYQTLVGTWPIGELAHDESKEYVKRIQSYMEKAIKEAKIHTSWINPNKAYDEQVHQFIQKALDLSEKNAFISDFQLFLPRVIAAGMLNSLSQVLLKVMSPGIPDFYQGNEIWDFSLVDPDNRRPVDFEHRKNLLKSLEEMIQKHPLETVVDRLLQAPQDGRIKLYVTWQSLRIRQKLKNLFLNGTYWPLEASGDRQAQVAAFAWTHGKKTVLAISGRFFSSTVNPPSLKVDPGVWQGTSLELPQLIAKEKFLDVFTGREITIEEKNNAVSLDMANVFSKMPLALLESIHE